MITKITPNSLNTTKNYGNKKSAAKDVSFEAKRVPNKKISLLDWFLNKFISSAQGISDVKVGIRSRQPIPKNYSK